MNKLLLSVTLSLLLSPVVYAKTFDYEKKWEYPYAKKSVMKTYTLLNEGYLYSNCEVGQTTCSHKKLDLKPSIEHIVTAHAIMQSAGCLNKSRVDCAKSSAKINMCLSNPYNLAPALLRVNQVRGKMEFTSSLGKDYTKPFPFDFRVNRTLKLVAPPHHSRGRIARAYKYMIRIGCIKADSSYTAMEEWLKLYPKTYKEQRIHDVISSTFPHLDKPENPFLPEECEK